MKWNFLGALALSTALASQSFGNGMMDRMLGSGTGCCCEPSCNCCEKSCCAEENYCCGNGCGSSCWDDGCGLFDGFFGLFDCGGRGCGNGCCCEEPSCCCQQEACCGCESGCCGNGCGSGCNDGCGLFDGLFGWFDCNRGCGNGCCCEEPSCCCQQEACCGCESGCCGNGCGSGCCNDGCGFFDGLFGLFDCGGCGNGCCEPSCGCYGNGCCNGNGTYHHEGSVHEADESAPAAPAEAGASIRPIPPRPMADPSAKVARERNVVRTSFVR
jgi:hypothetical protein